MGESGSRIMGKLKKSSSPSAFTETAFSPDFLEKLTFFQRFSPKEIGQILKAGVLFECAPGQYLVRERDLTRDLFVILSGKMLVTRMLYAGDERELGSIEPGEFFGEMAFLDGYPRSASVSCLEQGVVLKISRECFEKFCYRRPAVANKILNTIAVALTQRLRKSNDIVENFFSNPNMAIIEFKTRLLKIQTMLQRM